MNFKRTLVKIISLALAILFLAMPMASCSDKPILKLEDKELSVNIYEFLLSRMKGALEEMGYKTASPDFWNTFVSADGMTYGDYVKTQVLKQAYSYIVSDYLFDKEGLTLPKEDTDNIDALMDKLVERAGSKTNLNAELSAYGVNYKMLKEIYTIEAKMTRLKEYYYGAEGEKISIGDKDAYLNQKYVAFKQIFLAGYYYALETDDAGNTVYFVKTDDKDDRRIAYDTVRGTTKINEFGKPVTDKYGDPVYYDADGNIAYDTVGGVVSYMVDSNNEKIVYYYDSEKLGEIKDHADEIAGVPMTPEEFEALMKTESDGETDTALRYLFVSPAYYFNQSSSAKYLDDIAETLSKMKVGESRVVESDYGYHIIYKYENESGAYADEEYKDVFVTFIDDLIDVLFEKKCSEYENMIVYDSALFDKTPSMIDVLSNTLY